MAGIMMDEDLCYLICIPSLDEMDYLESIVSKSENLNFFVMNHSVQTALVMSGFHKIHVLNADTTFIDMAAVDQVIVLEKDLTSTHFLIDIVSASVKAPILIVTRNKHVPHQVYKLLGAKTVVYLQSKNINFLVN